MRNFLHIHTFINYAIGIITLLMIKNCGQSLRMKETKIIFSFKLI